ncbi:TPA_asm: L [Glycyrrhiza betacytorhabdovirus 1]|nr:TPA_asm: L [Glycyrrhiza betacytorhabdovirus 1]
MADNLDLAWLNEIFQTKGYSDEFSSIIIDDIANGRSNNMSGVGDFHLRSAIKKIYPEDILGRKGRYRERQDMLNFEKYFPGEKVISGDPSMLLSSVLIFKGDLAQQNDCEQFVAKRREDWEISKQATCRRIKMEINRDRYLMRDYERNDTLLREKILSSMSQLSPSIYFDLRSVFESLLMVLNSISSRRDPPRDSEIMGSYVRDKERNLLYACSLNKMGIVLGGDLVFVKFYDRKSLSARLTDRTVSYLPLDLKNSHSTHSDIRSIIMDSVYHELESDWLLFSADVLRMCADKLAERDLVLRNCLLYSPILDSIYPEAELIEDLLFCGDYLIATEGNTGYKAIKCYEAVMTGVLLSKCNSLIVDKNEFLRTTVRDLLIELPQFDWIVRMWIDVADRCDSDHHVSQLYGLYRLWGHPIVDSKEGLKKVMKLGTTKKIISTELAKRAGYSFLEEVYKRYKSKWGRYPVFKLAVSNDEKEKLCEASYLINCLVSNEDFDVKRDGYSASDWNYVISQKTFDIPDTFNLTMVVDDKAISPPKSYLMKVASGSEKFMNPFERRGVLKWMNEDYLNCSQFLKSINDEGLPDDDCVIGLYPKERELNSVPRMFALMSAKMRNYIVVTEHMIADDILPFFPQITMMDDLLSLTKKIYGTTRKQAYADHYKESGGVSKRVTECSVCMNMDFEKWNLNMRKESTYFVFQEMGRLYGLENLFNETYDMFFRSFIHVSDEGFELSLDYDERGKKSLRTDGIHSYTGHIGGFEGLRQKGWTVFTVSVIRMILADFPVTYKLMGQGDNQVLLITLKTDKVSENGDLSQEGLHHLQGLLASIISSLESVFLGLGLPLKTLESWRSENFFLYGKFPVKSGVPLSMSLKKLSRSFPFSNEDSMTTDNVLGSIFTNAQAACMSDIIHIPSYYSGVFETMYGSLLVSRWHPLLGKGFSDVLEEKVSWFTFENIVEGDYTSSKKIVVTTEHPCSLDEFWETLITCPKSLGGSNGITEYEFLMRGFPDNQTRDMTYLFEIIDSNKSDEDLKVALIVSKLMNFVRLCLSKSLNLDFLVEDPCAINLLQPKTPLTMLRSKIKNVLSQNLSFKNKNFLGLFKLSTDDRKRELLNHLASGSQLFPRLLHDCYAASLFGFVDGVVSKVDKTVTVQRMCLELSDEDLILGMCKIEENYIRYLFWRMNSFREIKYPDEPVLNCPTNYIRWARNFGWKREVMGVTVPYPSHTLRYKGGIHPLICSGSNMITCHISDYTPSAIKNLTSKLGSSPPYLGSYTKEKIKTYDRTALYSSEPLLKRVIRLMRILSWGNLEGSNLHDYLEMLLESMCDIDGSIFLVNKDDVGGSLEHRYKDSALKHGALASSIYTMGTWLHMSTDSLEDFSKGSKNVTLHFQAMLCWVQSRMYEFLLDRQNHGDSHIKEYHFHLHCRECIKNVEYDVPDIIKVPRELVPSLKTNPYCYTTNVTLTEKDRSIYASKDILRINKSISVEMLDKESINMLFHEYWAYSIAHDIMMDEQLGDDSISTGILEINKYPRIAFFRADTSLLCDFIIDYLMLWCFKAEAKRDKYKETALQTKKIKQVLLGQMAKTSPACFVGLSILFSWPEKLSEILSEDNIQLPESSSLSTAECMNAAKSLLLKKLNKTNEFFTRRCKYVNLSDSVPILSSLLLRYVGYYNIEGENSCNECRREVLNNIKDPEFYSLTGKESCSNRHHWFNKEFFNKNLTTICISEDSLSKKVSTKFLYPKALDHMERTDTLNIIQAMRSYYRIKPFLCTKDIQYSDVMTSKGIESREYSTYQDDIRQLYKCIPSDMSVGYRLLDVLIGLRLPSQYSGCSVLCLGDGTGSTGYLLNRFLKGKIYTSTLVDCTTAFPQTFKNSRPSCQYYSDDISQFDNRLSKLIINNIFDDKVISIYRDFVLASKITLGFCDIEMDHEEFIPFSDCKGIFPYAMLLRQLGKIPVSEWIVKMRVGKNTDMYQVIEMVDTISTWFDLYITPYCNNMKCEFFLRFSAKTEIGNFMDHKILNERTRSSIDDLMERYGSGRMFENLSKGYYLSANQLLLNDRMIDLAYDKVIQWMGRQRLNIDKDMKGFTKFFYSVAASRNPKEFKHHTDNQLKYEYASSLQELGIRIYSLGIARIKKDNICAGYMRQISSFSLVRPTQVHVSRGITVIDKYTYMIMRTSKVNEIKKSGSKIWKDRYLTLPPMELHNASEVALYVPIIRLMCMKENQFTNVSRLDEINFDYIRNRDRSNEQTTTTISLPVSKTCKLNEISMI